MEHELPRGEKCLKLKSTGIDSQITNTQVNLEFKKFSNASSPSSHQYILSKLLKMKPSILPGLCDHL